MTPKYGIFELCFNGPSEGNPFTDVTLSAAFRHHNTTRFVPGFYDGDGVYRIRFSPDIEGEWEYVTFSCVPSMNDNSGKLVCGPAADGSHGPVRVAEQFHFAHDDGTPFRPFGTTAYAWTAQEPEVVAMTLKTLSGAPFNKIRMSPFPKHYLYNTNEPPIYPYEGGIKPGMESAAHISTPGMMGGAASEAYEFDFTRPNPKFWRYFEDLVAKIGAMGIECDLILFHPYDRWGFSTMTREQNLLYLRYVVARLSAYSNIWWSFANEWDLFRGRTIDDWEAYAAEVVEWDASNHLRGIHNCTTMYDQSRSWITHVSWQRIDYHSHVELVAKMREQYRKPIMVDEICYEGDIDNGFGNITGEEMTKRFWDVTVRGGYCTHGETYLRDDELLWWAKGGELIGSSPARIAFLRGILEDCPGYIAPRSSRMDWDLPWGIAGKRYFSERQSPFGTMRMEFAEWMLCYFSFARPRFRNFTLPEDHSYKIDVIDTWDMTITTLPGEYSGMTRVDLPAKEYMAVRFREAN